MVVTCARTPYLGAMRLLLALALFAFIFAAPFHAAMAASKVPVAQATTDHCGSPAKPGAQPKAPNDKCCTPLPPALSPSLTARIDTPVVIRLAEPLARATRAFRDRAWEADPPPPRTA